MFLVSSSSGLTLRAKWLYVDSCWNVMAHGDAREGKWRENWRMEWVAVPITLPRNMVYPALLPLMRTTRLPVVDWTDVPDDLNGLVRFAERRKLVSARVPSHFKCSLPPGATFSNSTFCPQCVFMCFVWVWEQTVIFPYTALSDWVL
jgi:hypothetical protein